LVVAVSNDAVQTSDFIVRLLQLFSLLHSVVLVLLVSKYTHFQQQFVRNLPTTNIVTIASLQKQL